MVNLSLKKGSFLLLFPEDATTNEPAPFYVLVKSARKAKTVVTRLSGDEPEGVELTLDPTVAHKRVVAARDASGLRLGTWLRKAVCAPTNGSFRHGQVVDYKDDVIIVQTTRDRFSVSPTDSVTEVYPVVAMVMQAREWSMQEWTLTDIQGIHDTLIDSLLGGSRLEGDPAWISAEQWVHTATPHIIVDATAVYSWIEAETGIRYDVSLSHVVNYVYYVTGQGRVPPSIRRRLGHSFCDDPSAPSADPPAEAAAGQRPNLRPTTSRPRGPSLFEPEVVDDEEEKDQDERDVAVAIGAPHPQEQTAIFQEPRPLSPIIHPGSSTIPPPSANGAAPVDPDSELDFIEELRRSRPHLVSRYLARVAATTGPTKRPRVASAYASPVAKRGRYEFSPSPQQELVHGIITGETHRGTCGFVLVELLMAQPKFRFRVYPGVLVRAYDFQFGSRGLSVLHFKPLGYKEGLLAQKNATVSMTDFSAAATILPPPPVTSWAELASAVAGLVQYCQFCCDDTTQNLVKTLQSFVIEAEQWRLWTVKDLPLLVLWINSILEKYRTAVIADGYAGDLARTAVAEEFSVFNPHLQALLIADRVSPDTASTCSARDRPSRGSQVDQRVVKSERRVPPDVLAVLPRQNGKELCLRHLSKRGCQSTDPARCVNSKRYHSRPATLPTQIRTHVKSNFGGLCEQYQAD